MRYTKERLLLHVEKGNANVLKYDFQTFCNLMTSHGLTKYGSKSYFSEISIFRWNSDRAKSQLVRNALFNILL